MIANASVPSLDAVFALLEDRSDPEVVAWGKSFDWCAPVLAVTTAAEGASSVWCKVQTVFPAAYLIQHANTRLKRLLLREDMFSLPPIQWVAGQHGLPREPADFWSNVWLAAWSVGDERTLVQVEPWVSPETQGRGFRIANLESGVLWQWAMLAPSQDAQEYRTVWNRARESVRANPGSGLVFYQGRRRQRENLLWFDCVRGLASMAAFSGNTGWLHQAAALLPAAVRHPHVVRQAFEGGHWQWAQDAVASGIAEDPVGTPNWQPPALPEAAVQQKGAWLDTATQRLRREANIGRPPSENEAAVWSERAAWVVTALARRGGPNAGRGAWVASELAEYGQWWRAPLMQALNGVAPCPDELGKLLGTAPDDVWAARRFARDAAVGFRHTASRLSEVIAAAARLRARMDVPRVWRRWVEWSAEALANEGAEVADAWADHVNETALFGSAEHRRARFLADRDAEDLRSRLAARPSANRPRL